MLLALLSKENSVLVPLLLILIELTLFRSHYPWTKIKALSFTQKCFFYSLLSFSAIAFTLYSIDYASGGFLSRPFTMQERVLTELRVLSFYIYLIVIPKINSFGLFHDHIGLSTSLLSPWTTLTSIVFLAALIYSAFYYRTKNTLYSLGIGWFFTGHLLESTFFPLEIAHEHRNNLPLFGIIIAIAAVTLQVKISKPTITISLTTLVVLLGSTTWLRSTQWGTSYSQAFYETAHHPKSAAAQSIFAYEAYKVGKINESLNALKKAMKNAPKEAAYALFYQHELASTNQKIYPSIQQETMSRLKNGHNSATTINALNRIANCLHKEECKPLRQNYIEWINAAIKQEPQYAYYYYFKGKAYLAVNNNNEAFKAFQKAVQLDKSSVSHLIQIIRIFIKRGDTQIAKKLIKSLTQNYNESLNNEIEQLKNELNIKPKSQLAAPLHQRP
jgi:tetratricopeptide (TPR) repeat protein